MRANDGGAADRDHGGSDHQPGRASPGAIRWWRRRLRRQDERRGQLERRVAGDGWCFGGKRDEGIEDVMLQEADPQMACDLLVRRANAAGGDDNISVIVIQVEVMSDLEA